MSERALQCLISLCYIIHKIPSHLVLPCQGAEASVLILTLFFFSLCLHVIGAVSVKYLTGCMCAWFPCAAKCVFACCVDRDGDGR